MYWLGRRSQDWERGIEEGESTSDIKAEAIVVGGRAQRRAEG